MTYRPTLQHRMRLGDRAPAVRLQVRERGLHARMDWTGARVAFVVVRPNGEVVGLGGAAVVEQPYAELTVRYDWGEGDTAVLGAGWFRAEFRVTDAAGVVRVYPGNGWWIDLVVE